MARLRNIFRAIFNAFLGRTEDKYYGELLDLSFEQLQDRLIEAKQGLAGVAQAKHRLLQLQKKNRDEATKFETAAVSFVQAGDDDRARQALEQKAFVDQQLAPLQAEIEEVGSKQTALEGTIKELEVRIQQFMTRKEVMKASHTAAKAQVEIAEQFTGISKDAANIGRTVARLEEATEQLEAKSSGMQELMSSGALDDMITPGSTALDRSAAALERETSVNADLERIKKQLTPTTEAKTS
jgi:phage shock protein A